MIFNNQSIWISESIQWFIFKWHYFRNKNIILLKSDIEFYVLDF